MIDEIESCVSCGVDTEYTRSTNIYYRNYYIEGAGQLCKGCHDKIYS